MPYSIVVILALFLSVGCNKDTGDDSFDTGDNHLKVSFYNVQNLFDTLDDANKDDAEYLPTSIKEWNTVKYEDKLYKISKVIMELKTDVIGLCEIENDNVLKDLCAKMSNAFSYVHYESDDYRGIDVALLYKSDVLKFISSKVHKVVIANEPNYKTRDILEVKAVKGVDTINFIVCHYHSRLAGVEQSKPYRIAASEKVNEVLNNLPKTQLSFVMGDFNANPTDEPIALLKGLTNVAKGIDLKKNGSLPYDGTWQLYDQILYYNPGKYIYTSFNIFNPTWLTNQTGFYKDYPFRTYSGDEYLGGYSDHFPVYIEFNY